MKKIVCFGDSITAGGGLPEGRRWTAQLSAALEAIAPGEYAVYNRGVGGNTTHDGLHRMSTEILPLLPATVLIEFGFNDAVLMTNPPIRREFHSTLYDPVAYKKSAPLYNEIVRDVAAEHQVPLIDLETAMREAGVPEEELLAEDGLHLSMGGNTIYARLVLAGLKPILGLC